MTTPTNWPNPERPGWPLFADRSGMHHVGGNLLFWYSDIQKWVTTSPIQGCKEPENFAGDDYHGPVLTHTQLTELLAGERERAVAACLSQKEVFESPEYAGGPLGAVMERFACDQCIQEIRNLGAAP